MSADAMRADFLLDQVDDLLWFAPDRESQPVV